MTNAMERWEPAEPGQLQVGDYIRIDHRWFDHPFVRRMFRIGSDQEIATMRETQLTRIFVDRARPLPEAAPAVAPAESAAPPAAAAAEDPADREARLAEQREALAAAEAKDRVTRERAQEMLGMLASGDPASAAAMTTYIDYLVAILNNSTTPIAPIAPTAPRHSMTRMALLGSDAVWLVGTIGKRMKLTSDQLRALTQAAAAHVAGLTRLPPNLMEEEPRAEAQQRGSTFSGYPSFSALILEQCGSFAGDVVRIAREHRERPDGSGFPQGLRGDAIHPHALILGAVRELQVRCADGVVSPAVALAGIHRQLREIYGAEIVNHLAASLLIFPVGTYVQLSDGRTARILRVNEKARISPVVEVFGRNAELKTPEILDLSQREGLFIVRALDTSRLPPRIFEAARKAAAGSKPQPAKEPLKADATPEPTASQAPAPEVQAEAPPAQASGA